MKTLLEWNDGQEVLDMTGSFIKIKGILIPLITLVIDTKTRAIFE